MDFNITNEQQLLRDTVQRFMRERVRASSARKKIIAVAPRAGAASSGPSSPSWGCSALRSRSSTAAAAAPRRHHAGDDALGRGMLVEPYLESAIIGHACVLREPAPPHSRPPCSPRSAPARGSLVARARRARVALRAARVATPRRVREGRRFVLDGRKAVVLHARAADLLLVSARTGGELADDRGHLAVPRRSRARPASRGAYPTLDGRARPTSRSTSVRVRRRAACSARMAGRCRRSSARWTSASPRCAPRRSARCEALNDATRGVPQDAQAVRRADRQVPGAAAPHGRTC